MKVLTVLLVLGGVTACGPADMTSKTMELALHNADYGSGRCKKSKRWTECDSHLTPAESAGGGE